MCVCVCEYSEYLAHIIIVNIEGVAQTLYYIIKTTELHPWAWKSSGFTKRGVGLFSSSTRKYTHPIHKHTHH